MLPNDSQLRTDSGGVEHRSDRVSVRIHLALRSAHLNLQARIIRSERHFGQDANLVHARTKENSVKRRRALWVSTSMSTKGGVSSVVRAFNETPLWAEWDIHHVVTHRDGSKLSRMTIFVVGSMKFVVELVLRRPDLVHIHMSSAGSFVRKCILTWLARAFRLPVVIHMHGGGFDHFHDESSRPVRALIRATLETSQTVVALGDSWAVELRRIAPRARIIVIPNTVRAGEPISQPAPNEQVEVLFLGLVDEYKGIFVLIEAWSKIAAARIDSVPAHLTIAGDGDDVAAVNASIATLGVTESVTMAGWITSSEVPQLLSTAQILVLPSRMEGQPMAILEAMARGLCVIATKVGGVPDLIDDGCGILIAPDDVNGLVDALNSVIHDRTTRERLGLAAHQRILRDFDIEVAWRRFDELYSELTR